jgi:long-chain acyl-CoA synthetase
VGILPSDVFLSILPLAHTLECTVGLIIPILHGSSVRYIDKAPTPTVLLKAFEEVRPTMMLSVPLIIEKIYKNRVLPKFTGSALMRLLYGMPFFRKVLNVIAGKKLIQTFGGRMRFFGIGGAALSPVVEEFLQEAAFPYIIGYGLTESSPLIAGSTLGAKSKLKSTGTAMAGSRPMPAPVRPRGTCLPAMIEASVPCRGNEVSGAAPAPQCRTFVSRGETWSPAGVTRAGSPGCR